MQLNEIYEVNIIDDNHNGCGIAKINGMPIFIFGTLTGDVVRIKITSINKKFAIGELLSYIKKCDLHYEVLCPYYDSCGGCDLLHIDYERENLLKKEYIKRLFKEFDPKIYFYDRFSYRNKITLHVKNGVLGFYKRGSNDIVSIKKCLLVSDKINYFIDLFHNFDLSDINEVVIKEGNYGVLISILGNIKNIDLKKLISCKDVKSVYQNNILIYGDKYISHEFDNLKYLVNNNSFFQVNSECAKNLYDYIKSLVGNTNKLLDLYCGTGSIGIYLSDVCEKVVGAEINKDAVKCAKENIKLNNISNYNVILGDASIINQEFDFIVVDPPRSGLSKKVINNLIEMNPKKIIYVSCNSSTLKRDINLFNCYKLESINIFNMFPCTKHVETVCLLSRK